MSPKAVKTLIATTGLAALLATQGCSSVTGGLAFITSSSPEAITSRSLEPQERKEILEKFSNYAQKKKKYFSIDKGDTTKVFEQDVQTTQETIGSGDHDFRFFLQILEGQYDRRQNRYSQAKNHLDQAYIQLAHVLGEKETDLEGLAKIQTPLDYTQALWLYHDESALLLLDQIKENQLTITIDKALTLSQQHLDYCMKLIPSGRQAVAVEYFQRPQFKEIAEKYAGLASQ